MNVMDKKLQEQLSWRVNGQPALLHPLKGTSDKALQHIIDSKALINKQSQLMVMDMLSKKWGDGIGNPFGVLTIASRDRRHHLYGFRSPITFDVLCICIGMSAGYYLKSEHVNLRMLMLNN